MGKFVSGFIIGMATLTFMIWAVSQGGYESPKGTFFVKSDDNGYRVCIKHGEPTLCVSKAVKSPVDADALTKQLNRDMEGNW